MSILIKIYDNKALLGSRDDFENLINLIKNNDPTVDDITDNYDRTLLVKFNTPYNREQFERTLCHSVQSWLNTDITVPTKYIYNMLPLTQSQFILRI